MIQITNISDILAGDFIVKYPNILLGQVPGGGESDMYTSQFYTNDDMILKRNSGQHQYFFYRTMKSFVADQHVTQSDWDTML